MSNLSAAIPQQNKQGQSMALRVILIMGICHLLNDSLQAVVPAMFPILEKSMSLSFTQLGMIAFSLNIVSSLLQPAIGFYTDKKPIPFALPIGLTSTLIGVTLLALAPSYSVIIFSVMLMGLGSAVFHPEGSMCSFYGRRKPTGSFTIHLSGWWKYRPSISSTYYSTYPSPIRTKRCPMVFTSCFFSCTVTDIYSQVVFATVSLF